LLGVFHLRPLNGFADTGNIVAGVYWTLAYEWFFYGTLPLLGLLCGARPALRYLAIPLLSAFWLLHIRPPVAVLLPFVGGMLAAAVVRNEAVRRLCRGTFAAALIPVLLVAAVVTEGSAYSGSGFVLLTLVFVLIAGGNSLWGILERPASLFLGELAYGIYLFHGILLFLVFRLLIPAPLVPDLGPWFFWTVVIALTPILVLLSAAAHRWIERPGIRWGKIVAARLSAGSPGNIVRESGGRWLAPVGQRSG
jgi:peptidoglycan/LPS O-acetylase OafA/YrhL